MSIYKKKCPYCNTTFEVNDDLSYIIKSGYKECCDDCMEINNLAIFLRDYSEKQFENASSNDIYRKNLIKDSVQISECATSYTSRDFNVLYEVNDRSSFINEIIEKLEYVRRLLALEIGGQLNILDSIYEKKNIFKRRDKKCTIRKER